jgi:phosphomannomutase
MSEGRNEKIIALFDVDGTLTPARKEISSEMKTFIAELRKKIVIGTVGGSDLPKQKEQLGEDVHENFDYCFAENGLVAYKGRESLGRNTLLEYLGDEKVKEFVNFTLKYLADLDVPQKRGTFIEFRSGMMNISPVGRNCSREERNAFEKWDNESGCRKKMVSVLREEFGERFGLTFSIGGQISFDVFPNGWDKTYCLRFLKDQGYEEIHFFGDKTYEGGNDFEIFTHDGTIGHAVTEPSDTMKQLKELFF